MQRFRDAIERGRETGDTDAVIALLAEDVVFRSPVVYAPYHGRAEVALLLRAVVRVFDEFQFERRLTGHDGDDHALVFRARIADRDVEGCDFLHVDEHGLIDEFFVMVRPLSGATALAEAMKRELAIPRGRDGDCSWRRPSDSIARPGRDGSVGRAHD